MSSAPIDAAPTLGPATAAVLRPRRWVKSVLPQGLFGRSILIIVTPLVLLQIIATWVFYDRHWDTVARRLAGSVAGDIALVIDGLTLTDKPGQTSWLFYRAGNETEIDFYLRPNARLDPPYRGSVGSFEALLSQSLIERVGKPFRIAPAPDPKDVLIEVQLDAGVLEAHAPRKRLYTSTTYIFVLWMVGSSIVLFAVATMFMRNQVRSLRRLAAAADAFGKGRNVADFKLAGAAEIRQAASAFLAMRERIQRQITQRTEMLAGVSHDLRTPLTRMKLALALLGEGTVIDELSSDVAEMERMVQGYLDFARGEGAETPVETDLPLLLEEVAANARRDGAEISLAAPDEFVLPLRPNALKRCLVNLVSNARRHGTHIWLAAVPRRDGIDILIDDDGPGIPADQREAVFRPFFRLERSRNRATGGVGLGLTIARDVARGHGGDLILETSPQGGLRARVQLPA
jgi:two-component system osmolarity sensor histidine kinase EnvZ